MEDGLFEYLKEKMIGRFDAELDSRLFYHNSMHTLDVLCQAERIAKEEGVTHANDLMLLKLAALYHDAGFLFTYEGHEYKGCEILRHDLEPYGFPEEQLELMCGLIMATKI